MQDAYEAEWGCPAMWALSTDRVLVAEVFMKKLPLPELERPGMISTTTIRCALARGAGADWNLNISVSVQL